MTSNAVLTARPGDTLALALQMMIWGSAQHLPVVQDGRVLGLLTLGDIFRYRAEAGGQRARRDDVVEAMSRPAITIGPEEPVTAALSKMLARRIGALPVVSDEGELRGLVTRTDLLRHQLEEDVSPEAPGTQTAADIMTAAPAVGTRGMSLLEAATLMARRGIRHLPIVDGENRLEGMLSDRDLRVAIGDPGTLFVDDRARQRAKLKRAGEVMSLRCAAVAQTAPLTTVVHRLIRDRVGALAVLDGAEKLAGVISYLDVLRVLGTTDANR